MIRYIIGIVSVEEAAAANAAANTFFSDAGNNLSQPLSPSGAEPATHLYGGAWVGDATWAALQAFAGGLGLSTMQLREEAGPDAEALPELARQALFAEFGVVPIEASDGEP